ncbi:unnamed protein product [Brassica napus]|nr:unnamed protein product [Brassica napus]
MVCFFFFKTLKNYIWDALNCSLPLVFKILSLHLILLLFQRKLVSSIKDTTPNLDHAKPSAKEDYGSSSSVSAIKKEENGNASVSPSNYGKSFLNKLPEANKTSPLERSKQSSASVQSSSPSGVASSGKPWSSVVVASSVDPPYKPSSKQTSDPVTLVLVHPLSSYLTKTPSIKTEEYMETKEEKTHEEEASSDTNEPVRDEEKPSPLAEANVMNVILVAAECAPFSKTGGLGDVAGALPKALARLGHRVMVVVPRYAEYEEAKDVGVRKRYEVAGQDMEVMYFHGVDFVFIDSPVFRHLSNNIYGGNRLDILKRMVLFCKAAVETLHIGKPQCKAALQREVGLLVRPDVPLIGFIERLDHQKGVDLITVAVPWMMSQDVQLVMLGSGRPDLEEVLRRMEYQYRDKARGWVGFSVRTAHRITAGADVLLMPSRFEPCGLNQLYAMKYGTVPVVHAVGGLRDTVQQFDPYSETGLGWTFDSAEAGKLIHALGNCLLTYREYKESWEGLLRRGMAQDLSWDNAAENYEEVLVAAKYQW